MRPVKGKVRTGLKFVSYPDDYFEAVISLGERGVIVDSSS